jgi:hypothetical protein
MLGRLDYEPATIGDTMLRTEMDDLKTSTTLSGILTVNCNSVLLLPPVPEIKFPVCHHFIPFYRLLISEIIN